MGLTLPIRTSSVASIQRNTISRMTHLMPVTEPDDRSILSNRIEPTDEPGDVQETDLLNPDPVGVRTDTVMSEGTNYDPSRSYNKISPASADTNDIGASVSELDIEASRQKILEDQPEESIEQEPILADDPELVPSDIVDYYDECVKVQNPKFHRYGLPHLRQYPLNCTQNVLYALNHYRQCIDPKDRVMLVENAIKAAQEFHISETNVALQQAKEGIGIKPIKSNADAQKCHVHYNTQFYNHVFYNKDYAKAITNMNEFAFMEYFHPNLITHSFISRVSTSIGGLGIDKSVYQTMGIRYPFETDFTKPLGWCDMSDYDFNQNIIYGYIPKTNWFRVDLSKNVTHVKYCLMMYSILGEILIDPDFTVDRLSPNHLGILTYWPQHVTYHYDRMKAVEEYTTEWYQEIQYLHDLCWNFLDDPYNIDDRAKCISAFATIIAAGNNDSDSILMTNGELITKADVNSYMQHELQGNVIYLLPDTMEYPIINKASVRLAMDCIRQVEQEHPNELKTYCNNLNQAYRKLGCTFSLSVDHPYAQYADSHIIKNMVNLLVEGNTAVDDSDGASDMGGPSNQTDQPWYKRMDYTGTLYRDGSENKEMGPNEKPMQKPDWTQHLSIL